MHSAKIKNSKGSILKIDLSKAFDRVSWLYLRLLLTHPGFNYSFIKRIFACITTTSFVVLINGAASPFFHSKRGLRQGSPLSPLLFLLVAEGLSRAILDAKRRGFFEGIKIATNLTITHLLFVDDILIFCNGSIREVEKLSEILHLFCKATWMQLNSHKYTITTFNLEEDITREFMELFPFQSYTLDEGLKYLGFRLKPNCYKKED